MRRPIETVPKDGKVVILEDDASGTFELAHWSAEARAWVRENGELSKITPTYWHATRRDEYLLQEGDEFLLQKEIGSSGPSAPREHRTLPFPPGRAAPQSTPAAGDNIALREVAKADPVTVARLEERAALGKAERGPSVRRQFAVSSIATAMVAASLVGWYFRAEIAGYVTRYAGQQDSVGTGTAGVQVVEQETRSPGQDSSRPDAAQARQGAEPVRPEAERRRAEALASDLAKAQQVIETQVALASKTRDQAAQLKQAAESTMAELRQSLQKEHDRAEALAGELAKAQRDIETRAALSGKMGAAAAQLKQAADSAKAELQQSLQKEHDRAETLAGELASAQRDVETQVALASKAGDEATQLKQLKQAAESAAAELRQSLQKEHDRAETLAGKLAGAQRDNETQAALASKTYAEAAQLEQAAESATAELRQSLQKEHDRAEALAGELASAQRNVETQVALASKTGDEATQLTQVKQAAESAAAELRQSLQKEHDRAEALASELASAQRDIKTQAALASKTGDEATQLKQFKQAAESAAAELRKSQQQEHDRAEALADELAKARSDMQTQAALSSKAGDEAAQLKQFKQAAESAAAELRQSLKKEHDRAEALASELASAQRDIKTQVALASKAGDEATQLKQLKQAAESAKTELRKSQERDRAEALAPGRESAQPTVGARMAAERASNSPISQATQVAEAPATEQPAAAEVQGSPEAARLLARASALLAQGNIGAARIVLERAVETGSAQASFMLAETYDPLVLSTWKTYGTRGDATKARELYAKAQAGGIQEAKDRSDALR